MTLSVALLGTDLIGQARTGTGKTLAFGIPLLQRTAVPGTPAYDELAAPGKPQALVVAPTRELAVQVSNDLSLAAKDLGARVLTVYGGVPYEPQLDALKEGVDVVVGTPGRLIDLVNRGSLVLSHVQALVLDEADEMLDLGFLPDVERLLRETPASRQTMLFSATMPGAIVSLARSHMHHPVNIRAESAADTQMVPATAQFIFQVHDLDKTEMLARIFQAEGAGRAIVFTRTKRAAQRVADDLAERGFPASPLHGDMAQVAREKALQRFREGKVRVMVATDVAARGIDVQDVTHVINHSCPEDHNTYVHRIGRTGRAGATGVAITFVDWQDITRWNVINKALDLPHNDPPETYSTSPHFFELLGIPTDAKGSVGEPVGGPRKDADKPRSDEARQRPARKRTDRTRTRTRGGQQVAGDAASTPTEQPAAAEASSGEGSSGPRRRRRRRSGGGNGNGGGGGAGES
jgi:superfamily II DNA/RNA helicase